MTTTRPAPNLRGNYPLAGDKIGPAWRAAWNLLRTRERYTAATELLDVMTEAGDIATKTAEHLLRVATRRGVLDIDRRDHVRAGKRQTRSYYRIAGGAR